MAAEAKYGPCDWMMTVYRLFTGGKPRRVCREDRGEAGEDHR